MKKILIIGAGFGGLSAARILSKTSFNVTLVDKKETFDFLPMLPDCLGRGITPDFLGYRIEELAKRYRFDFINEEVLSVSLDTKEISTANKKINFDYLIISVGSETNFYGNENIRQNSFKLDSVEDAKKIISILNKDIFDNYIVAGGGYTGVEVATNLSLFLKIKKRLGKVVVVERAPSLLGVLPEWMKEYVLNNFKNLGIGICVNSSIEKIEGKRVFVSGDKIFENSLVIWAAGVKAPSFVQNLNVEKNPQGRVKVDDFLRLSEFCFIIGDASYFSFRNNYLRMAVQFAITQGECAAINVTRGIQRQRLIKYKPLDFGYIIPMANNKSCGRVFGVNLKGAIPTLLHFLMCIYRSFGFRNRFGIIKDLLKGGGK
ncbi:MAG: FAD-dependent oxidoreductase [Candidatus Omnitrophica bacterium]|nr:FAD-dependent oxidoreductase [Candidatus Omnitrophota bacterium]